jgi:hypothetical protein
MLGAMTDRQRTWTEHALDTETARRVTPSARAHLRRMVWLDPDSRRHDSRRQTPAPRTERLPTRPRSRMLPGNSQRPPGPLRFRCPGRPS